MFFSTNTKLKIARLLYGLVKFSRKIIGNSSDLLTCKRNNLTWSLNLKEGIDLSVYLFGCFEPKTEKAIRQYVKPGMTVLDIGANVGAHALPLAKYVGPTGRVYAIEPTDHAFKKLLKNKSLNPDLENTLIPIKATLNEPNGNQPKEIYSSWNLIDKNERHPRHGGVLSAVSNANNITLDALVEQLNLSRIDFVKMDVDGFECRILRGAKNTFRRFRPTMILELSPYVLEEQGDSIEILLNLLREFGYQLYHENNQKQLPQSIPELLKLIPKSGGINAIALQS